MWIKLRSFHRGAIGARVGKTTSHIVNDVQQQMHRETSSCTVNHAQDLIHHHPYSVTPLPLCESEMCVNVDFGCINDTLCSWGARTERTTSNNETRSSSMASCLMMHYHERSISEESSESLSEGHRLHRHREFKSHLGLKRRRVLPRRIFAADDCFLIDQEIWYNTTFDLFVLLEILNRNFIGNIYIY